MTVTTRRMTPLLAALATTGVLLAPATVGCTTGGDRTGAARPTEPPREKVTYLTGFGAFGREGYAWVAKEKGYFAEAGIEVEIQPGAAGDANLRLLAANRAQFGVIDYAGAVVRAGNGGFRDFRLVGAVTEQTLIAIMALAGGNIVTPSDLAGKTIAQATGAVPKTLFEAYARLAGFDPRGVRWVQTGPQQLPVLLASRKVDAIGQFVVGEPAIRRAAKDHAIVTLPYSDYLTDLYGNVVVTSAALLNSNPDLARRFTQALLKGLRYAVDHPQETADILHRAVPATDAVTAAAELTLMKPYVGTGRPGVPFGSFDVTRVARSIALMQSLRLIPTAVQPEEFVSFGPMGGGSPR
jgi:NitT/TauT family transport system substrate-binding protein